MSQLLHGVFCMQYLEHTYNKKKLYVVYLRALTGHPTFYWTSLRSFFEDLVGPRFF